MGDLTGSASESSPSDSDDRDRTLLCFKLELDNILVLVCLDVFVLRLDMLAALETSQGGEIMLARTFFHENASLSTELRTDSLFLAGFDTGLIREFFSLFLGLGSI
jgi:hypothetical protein